MNEDGFFSIIGGLIYVGLIIWFLIYSCSGEVNCASLWDGWTPDYP